MSDEIKTVVIDTLSWAKNERGNYEMTGASMKGLLRQTRDMALREAVGRLLELRMDNAAAMVSGMFGGPEFDDASE